MKTFLLIYAFTFASGNTLEAEGITLRATPEMCERICVECQSETQRELLHGNGVLQKVVVRCLEVRQ